MKPPFPWNAEHDEFIRNNAATMTTQEIADHLGGGLRNTHVLDRMYRNLGLHALQPVRKGRKQYKAWTEDELTFIKVNANKLTTEQMAEKLGRTIQSVKDKRYVIFYGRSR